MPPDDLSLPAEYARPALDGAAGILAGVLGCGGETTPDAATGPCWPLEATEGGEVTIAGERKQRAHLRRCLKSLRAEYELGNEPGMRISRSAVPLIAVFPIRVAPIRISTIPIIPTFFPRIQIRIRGEEDGGGVQGEAEVVGDGDLRLVRRVPGRRRDQFGFERAEEALDRRIVPAVAATAHADDDAAFGKRRGAQIHFLRRDPKGELQRKRDSRRSPGQVDALLCGRPDRVDRARLAGFAGALAEDTAQARARALDGLHELDSHFVLLAMRDVSARSMRLFAWPRRPSRMKLWRERIALTICGTTVSS